MKEDIIQAEIYQWFHNNYCLNHHKPKCAIFSVPNGGTRNKREAVILKATGLVAGVSDLIVLLPSRCIFVEVKTDIGSQSDKQKEFQKTVEALGFEYYLVRSLQNFKQIFSSSENNIYICTMKKQKIYISGKISGIEDEAPELFEKAEKELINQGYDAVNPMKLLHNHDKSWQSYMREDIKALCDCDAIYMLKNFKDSRGACIERHIASSLDMKIIYE